MTIPASCAGRDKGLLCCLPPGIGFSFSSKCKRVLPLPVASSKVRSRVKTFFFGIAARASSKRSAALSDLRIAFSNSGVTRSSSENCKREVFVFAVASACARLTAFLDAARVCAPSIRSKTRSAVAASCFGASPGARGGGDVPEDKGLSCAAASCAACSCCFERSASCARLLISSAVSLVSFTSISPSRLIFCVILSRGFIGSFNFHHLQSAPLQGRNSRNSVQCRYSGGQGFSPQVPLCRFRKTGQGQRRLLDSPPKCTFPQIGRAHA